jgi:hypothetical protein
MGQGRENTRISQKKFSLNFQEDKATRNIKGQRILRNPPPACNYANINSHPFDLNHVATEGSLDFLQSSFSL